MKKFQKKPCNGSTLVKPNENFLFSNTFLPLLGSGWHLKTVNHLKSVFLFREKWTNICQVPFY